MSAPYNNSISGYYQQRGNMGNDGERSQETRPSVPFPVALQVRGGKPGSRTQTVTDTAMEAQRRGQVGHRSHNP